MVNQGNLGIVFASAVYMDRIRAAIKRMAKISTYLKKSLIHLLIRKGSEDYLCSIRRGPEYAGVFCILPYYILPYCILPYSNIYYLIQMHTGI